MGKNITSKKAKGKQYHIPYDIKAVWKNINLGRREGDGNFEAENIFIKKMGVGRI